MQQADRGAGRERLSERTRCDLHGHASAASITPATLTGFEKFIDYTQPPFKERQENLPKRNIIQVFNGDKGWELDRGGVTDAPQADLLQFKEDVLKDIDNILRHRIHEPGMILRYGGPDIVDLKQVDWVETGGQR